MIEGILASIDVTNVSSILMLLVIVAAYVFIFALVIICLIRISRYFLSAGKEQKLIRMELGKLAEEVHLLRQEQKDGKDSEENDSLD
jgi:hypothetical protein